MTKENQITSESLLLMTEMQAEIFAVESYLNENYQFRRNVLNGKVEFCTTNEEGTTNHWHVLTQELLNGIVRKAKKDGIGDKKSPRQNIEEFIFSDASAEYDPIREYLTHLPSWDGKNHVEELFSRIPGITSEQLGWCATWLRSAVAHWMGMDSLHANECVPVLIGAQGCGKSTFAYRILPEQLREYYLDHINFANKFDSEMALTHNLIVNIDEFANMGPSQQGKLKQTLSKVKVNGRPIFGKAQEDRRRYASFLATTNDTHPLCDSTGSRRYICIRIHNGQFIDNATPINHDQLFAQLLHELHEECLPYWFGNDEVLRIQQANLPYFRSDDMEGMIISCFHLPEEDEKAEWVSNKTIVNVLCERYPNLQITNQTRIRIGQTLRFLGCQSKRMGSGVKYQLIPIAA